MIHITEAAKKKIKELRNEEGFNKHHHLRISVTSGGCSGLTYNLSFDDQITKNDKVFEHEEIKLIVNKPSLLYLLGTSLDFSGGLNGKGLHFINPNASRTCGCGESFAV